MNQVWNVNFDKVVPDGAAGNQAMLGIFYKNERGLIRRLTQAEGNQRSLNPEEVERNPIGQEAPTTMIRSYKVSFDKGIIITKGEENYEFFANWYRLRPTGENVKLPIYLADFRIEETGTNHNKYYCESMTVTCSVTEIDETEGTLNVSFSQDGEMVIGVIGIADESTAGNLIYEFIPSTKIAITAINASDTDIEMEVGDERWIAISFVPLGCPFDFTVSTDNDCVEVGRLRQSVTIKAVKDGTATVTVTSTADSTKTRTIEVAVGQ